MENSEKKSSGDNPFNMFREWYTPVESEGMENFNAVALSTATSTGRVSSRIVLLKGYGENGFVFFTNYNSRKGEQLRENNRAAMLFYWPQFGKQVRIEGIVTRTTPEESDAYFNSRSRGHKFNALVSPQSREIEDIQELLSDMENRTLQYRGTDPPRPANWGGYRLIPEMFEFWKEGIDRFHSRLEYRLTDGEWSKRVLAP
jgi:pyridoxamine 5'-phosphate oxidase